MDPIHPIRPTSANPAPVDPIRRVTRAGEQTPRDEQPPRDRRRPRSPAPAAPPPAVSGDGHVDALA